MAGEQKSILKHKHDWVKTDTVLSVEYTSADSKLYSRKDHFKCRECLEPMTSGSSTYAMTAPKWWKEGE